jgi:hypothetical protein
MSKLLTEQEEICPLCGCHMKEFITMTRCRNLACRFRYYKNIEKIPDADKQEVKT